MLTISEYVALIIKIVNSCLSIELFNPKIESFRYIKKGFSDSFMA